MSFEPKQKVDLDPPKDDIITLEYLSKCDGELSTHLRVRKAQKEKEREIERENKFSRFACVCVSFTYQISAYIGKHEGYPTYVAIKVSRNCDCDLLLFVLEKGGGGH